MVKREKLLIMRESPCNIDYFDRTILTVEQAVERGNKYCVNFQACENGGICCALYLGLQVAQNVVNGKDLKKVLEDLAANDFVNEEVWNSVNGRDFERIKGKGEVLRAVEGFARVVLLEDPFKSVYPKCKRCDGIMLKKEVYDSVWLNIRAPGAGTGEVKVRTVSYCPECDQEPSDRGVVREDF